MSFAFFLLASHKDVQEKLHAEIESAFEKADEEKEASEGRATFDMKMPYLDGVVFESMRLFPAVSVDLKQAARDSVLPNGVAVPKGTIMTFEP